MSQELFEGGGEMGALMRSLDWSQTLLGPVSGWPQSLKTAVSILLNSRYPMFVWWGRDYANLYNDAYRPILGARKHPQFLGQSARDCWADIWNVVGPMADSVFATGQPTWSENLLLIMERNGYTEETYFTFSYSPVRDESGGVGGIFCAVIETTEQIIGERRLQTLRELSASTAEAKTVEEAVKLATAALSANPHDIPFALFYQFDAESQQAALVGTTTNLAAESLSIPQQIELNQARDVWNLTEVMQTGIPAMISNLTERFGSLPGGAWSECCNCALVMPIAKAGKAHELVGFLIVGISPRREFDDRYRGFFDLVANQVATAIANADAYEAERRRAEALAELDRAKTDFFSNVSHEFRTPLTLTLAPLEETLANPAGPVPSDREQLETAYRNSQRLLKLVNTLLDFSRIEAGRIEAVYEPTDLAMLTTDLAGVFRSAIERAGLRLRVDCPPLPEPVYVDREMWEKIVLNLLSNAFKFTFEGEIAVILRAGQDRVELAVQDTGTGIPAQELPRIFERFHRVKAARGRSYEGSGIGLALVQELVKLHGGTVEVSSIEAQGTCFTVSLPLGSSHLPPDRIAATRSLVSTATGAAPYVEEVLRWISTDSFTNVKLSEGGQSLPIVRPQTQLSARILLVDDNADMRDYVRRLLASQGYEVETAIDGVAALSAIRESVFDLVLTDVMMPRLDGFGLLKELRSHITTRDIPMILLSARAGEEARIEGLESGADDYLTKPFSARELLARVEAVLKLSRLRRDAIQQEQALRQEAQAAKQQVETILSSINDGFYVLDRDWRFTYVNDRYCEMVQMQREAILGQNVWELFPAAIATEAYVKFHQAMREQTSLQFDYLYLPWNCWHDHRVYPSPSSLTVLLSDITERKRSELMLIEQKRLLELIASGQPLDECLLAVCHAITRLNPGTRACFLLADEERQTFPRSITPDLPSSFGQGLKDAPINDLCIGTCGEAVYRGQAIACTDIANDARWSQEWRNLCLIHGIRGCHSTPVMGIARLPLGSLMLCFDTARMPTEWEYQLAEVGTQIASIAFERDRSLAALKASEAQSRDILQSINDGFLALDENWQYIYLNQAAAILLGRTVEDLTGKNIWEEYPGLIGTEFERVYRSAMCDRVASSATAFYPDHNRYYEVRAYPATKGITIYFQNVSDRIQIERDRERLLQQEQAAREAAERANRVKDEFLAVLSHELRSPLNPILGWTKLLQTRDFDARRAKEALAVIERNAKLQVQLIDDLLDISRIIQGKLNLNSDRVSLLFVISSALETVRLCAEAKRIQIETILEPGEETIIGDAARLQQVVWNLLSNAVKFTHQGGKIVVKLEQENSGSSSFAKLTVTDNGKGIKPEFLPHIFEYFRQEDASTTRKFGGLGLGLAIARQIVEMHGGTVAAESQGEGCGATFTVRLPLQNDTIEARQDGSFAAPSGQSASLPLKNIHVFVVDDDKDTLEFYRIALESSGAKVTTASSAAEAMQRLSQVTPDILLSDIGMPNTNGYMLMEQLKESKAFQTKPIPAIALTAYASDGDRELAFCAGFQAHLAKPIDSEALIVAILQLFN